MEKTIPRFVWGNGQFHRRTREFCLRGDFKLDSARQLVASELHRPGQMITEAAFPRHGGPTIGPMLNRPAFQNGKGTAVDEMMAVLAFIILPIEFPMMQPLRAPFALLFLVYGIFHWRQVMPVLAQGKWLFLLPAMSVLSVLWADRPGPAMYHGIMMALAMAMAAILVARLDHRQIVTSLFVSQAILAIASLTDLSASWAGGLEGGYVVSGIFPYKTILGTRMAFMMIAAIAILFGSGYGAMFRLAAMIMVPVGLFLVAKSMAITSFLILAAILPVGIFLVLIWGPAGQIRALRPAILFGGLTLLTLAVLVIANTMQGNPVDLVLNMFGKDRSLTGRTDIWLAGNHVIEQNPLLGVGAGNFWQLDNSAAVRIAGQFGVEGNRFYFHSVFYEVMVHLGLIGLLVACWVYGRVFFAAVRYWWSTQSRMDPFFICLAAMLAVRTLTESILFQPLILDSLLFWAMGFLAICATKTQSA